ncbi:MAG TPA: OsmC family protein [Bacteroidales bacterium]|nr:OsmC family protein [Bacteroidales bacterium]
MTDKNKQVAASLNLVNDRLLFEGIVEGNKAIAIDYIPPFGDNLGYTSLELLLLSLSSCIGTALLVRLRRQGKNVENFSVKAEGTRRQSHPTSLEEIHLYIDIKVSELTTEEFDAVIASVKGVCPVWDMIKERTSVIIHHQIAA